LIGAVTWFPLSTDPVPDVCSDPVLLVPVTLAPPVQVAVDAPSRATAFPHTSIGMLIGMIT
jgi:hypothetical protein